MSAQKAMISVAEFRQILQDQHPFAALLGMEIIEIGHRTARLLLPDDTAHRRLGGVVAGPMLMALTDLALYAAIVGATGNTGAVTCSLSINFIRGAPPGGIEATARIVKTGRISVGEVHLYPRDNTEPVAHAISTWALPVATERG